MKNKIKEIELVEGIANNLEIYNHWRRGELRDFPASPQQLGITIDYAVRLLKEYADYLKLDFFIDMPEKKFQKELDKAVAMAKDMVTKEKKKTSTKRKNENGNKKGKNWKDGKDGKKRKK